MRDFIDYIWGWIAGLLMGAGIALIIMARLIAHVHS